MSIEQYWENILTIIFDNEQVNKESAFALFCEAFPTLGKEHKKYHRFYPAVYEGVKEWADSDIQVVKVLSQRYKQSFRYNNQVLMEAYQAQDALRKMNIESLLFKIKTLFPKSKFGLFPEITKIKNEKKFL